MAQNRTISLPDELHNYLNENPDLSPSKILQEKLKEIIERQSFKDARFLQLRNVINGQKETIEKQEKAIRRYIDLNEKLEKENEELKKQKV